MTEPTNMSQSDARVSSGGVLVTAQAFGLAQSFPGACPHCSSPFNATFHSGPCPRVKAIEYHPNGAVKRIEFREGTTSEPGGYVDA